MDLQCKGPNSDQETQLDLTDLLLESLNLAMVSQKGHVRCFGSVIFVVGTLLYKVTVDQSVELPNFLAGSLDDFAQARTILGVDTSTLNSVPCFAQDDPQVRYL